MARTKGSGWGGGAMLYQVCHCCGKKKALYDPFPYADSFKCTACKERFNSDNLNDKISNEAESQPYCLGAVSGSYIPQKGDLFEWCDEKYWCIESGNYSGVVNPVGETFYQRGFIWNYGNEKPIFVRKATEQEFENMFGSL